MESPQDFYRGVTPPASFRTVGVVDSRVGQRKAPGGPRTPGSWLCHQTLVTVGVFWAPGDSDDLTVPSHSSPSAARWRGHC